MAIVLVSLGIYFIPLWTLAAIVIAGSGVVCYKFTGLLKHHGIWIRLSLLLCWGIWIAITWLTITLSIGYRLISNDELLKEFVIHEIAKTLKSEVAGNLQPPDRIVLSWKKRQVIIEKWQIPDAFGGTLASVDRLVIYFHFAKFRPTVQSIVVEKPRIFLRRDEQGRLNAAILRDVAKGKGSLIPHLPEIHIYQGEVVLNIVGLTDSARPFAIEDINFHFTSSGGNVYKIAGKFDTLQTQTLKITGTYSPDQDGLAVTCQPFSFALDALSSRLHLPAALKIGGKINLDQIDLRGLSSRSPQLEWHSQLTLVDGSVCWRGHTLYTSAPLRHEGKTLGLSRITGKVLMRNGRLSEISTTGSLGTGRLSIDSGYITPNGHVYLPFQLANLKLDDDIPRFLEELGIVDVWQHWKTFQPQGSLNLSGIVSFSDHGKWQGNVQIHLADGSFQYRKLRVTDIDVVLDYQSHFLTLNKANWQFMDGRFAVKSGARFDLNHFPPSLQGLEISFHDLLLTPFVWQEIPEAKMIWQLLQPEGLVGGKITWQGIPSLQNLPDVELSLHKCKAIFEEVPHPAQDVTAKIQFHGDSLNIDVCGKLTGNVGSVKVYGQVWPFARPYYAGYDVYVEVRNALINDGLYRTFSKEPMEWREDVKEIWDRLGFCTDQKGHLDVLVHARRRPGTPEYTAIRTPYYDVSVIARNAKAQCEYFSYPISDVCGQVDVVRNEPIIFSNIKAKKDKGNLSISGRLLPTPKGIRIESLTVKGQDIALDKDLKKALGDEAKIWDEFSPKGHIDIEVNLRKDVERPIVWQAVAQLREVKAEYQKFPYSVDHIHGTLQIQPENFILKDITGGDAPQKIAINGTVSPGQIKIDIAADHITLDKKLRIALDKLSPDIREISDKFHIQGPVHGNIQLRQKGKNSIMDWKVFLEFADLNGYYTDFRYGLQKLNGKVNIFPQGFEIQNCRGKSGNGEISIVGEQRQKGKMELHINSTNIKLDQKLYNALSEDQRKIWKQFRPRGSVNLGVDINQNKAKTDYMISLVPQNCSIYYSKFPYQVDKLRVVASEKSQKGGVLIHSTDYHDSQQQNKLESVVFKNLVGEHGTGRFQLNGSFYPKIARKQNLLYLEIFGQAVVVDEKLRHALQEFFPKIMQTLVPQGKVEKMRLYLSQHEGSEDYLRYKTDMTGLRVKMKKDSFLEELAGNIDFEGFGYRKRYHGRGYIREGELVLHGLHFDHIQAPIQFFHDYLQFPSIQGNFYQGAASGSFIMDTTPYGAYKGVCNLARAQLASVVQALSSKEKPKNSRQPGDEGVRGILSGELSFQGNFHNSNLLTGRGWFEVQGGEIWRFPLLLAIFDIFSLPEKPAFRSGDLQFSISRRNIEISLLRLHSSLLSLSGSGRIDFDGNLDLKIMSHFALRYLPRIPVFDKVWQVLKQDFFELYVTGTLRQPSVVLPQWKTLRELIK